MKSDLAANTINVIPSTSSSTSTKSDAKQATMMDESLLVSLRNEANDARTRGDHHRSLSSSSLQRYTYTVLDDRYARAAAAAAAGGGGGGHHDWMGPRSTGLEPIAAIHCGPPDGTQAIWPHSLRVIDHPSLLPSSSSSSSLHTSSRAANGGLVTVAEGTMMAHAIGAICYMEASSMTTSGVAEMYHMAAIQALKFHERERHAAKRYAAAASGRTTTAPSRPCVVQ